MKKQFNSIALLAVVSASLFVSCSKDTDLYDSNLAQKEYEQKWVERFGEVAADQDWNLATQVTATMSITEDALAKYNLQLFTANPLYDEDALLIADYEVETDANGYATVTFKCDVAKSATQLYAVRKDSHNRRLVKLADISNGTIDVSFGGSSTKAGTRIGVENINLPVTACPYSVNDINKMLADANTVEATTSTISHNQKSHFCDIVYASSTFTAKITSDSELSTWTNISGYAPVENQWKDSLPEVGKIKLIIANNAYVKVAASNYKLVGMDIIVTDSATLDVTDCTQPYYMGTNSRIIIMPGGKLVDNKTDRSIYSYSLDMQGTLLYNAGTIDMPVINVNNGNGESYVYNAPTGVINVTNFIFSNSSTELTNWGHFNATNVYGNPSDKYGQGTINNGCNMVVTNELRIASLNQDANTSIECNKLLLSGDCSLRENTIVRAKDLYINNVTIKYVGKEGKHALVSTDNVYYVNFKENLDACQNGTYQPFTGTWYLEVNTYNGESTESSTRAKDLIEAATKYISGYGKVGEINYSIPAGDCTGSGNTPTDKGGGGNENANYWIIACEDLGSTDDYDFNDVVVKIAYVSGSNEVEITPLAAGGTLKSEIYFKDKDGNENRIGEIHELFGGTQGEDGLYSVVNANGSGKIFDKSNAQTAQSVNYGVTEGFSISNTSGVENMGGFFIKVTENAATGGGVAKTISAPDKKGIVPQMFCVDSNWSWPTEGTDIEDAYPGFKTWTGDTNYTQWTTQTAE